MKKPLILVLLLLLFTVPAYGEYLVSNCLAPSGGTCSTGTEVIAQTYQVSSLIFGASYTGQTFRSASEISLYSITVRIVNPQLLTGTAVLRVGAGTNLSVTYDEVNVSSLIAALGSTSGDIEVVIPDHPTIAANTTWSFALFDSNADSVQLSRNADGTDRYASGGQLAGGTWSNLGAPSADRDLYFRIKACN